MTGWIGYTPTEALAANVNDLQIALRGRRGLLKEIFGSGKDDPGGTPPPLRRPMTAARFRDIAEQHNAKVGRKKRNG